MSTTGAEWINLDTSKYDSDKPEFINGVTVHLYVSPYDMPDAVRGFIDPVHGKFAIELKYMSDEPREVAKIDEHAWIHVGRRSGRVYRIDVDTKALNVEDVRLMMTQAIHYIGNSDRPVHRNEENYKVVEQVIGDNWPAFARSLDLASVRA